jgi:eukaryotic-like serine/threonine-protein kinase
LEVIPPPAYEGAARSLSDIPNPEELQKLPINDVRQILNSAVASILPNEGDAEDHCLADFDTFRRKYLLAIAGAAALEPNSIYDTLYHYKLIDVIGEGAFGRVYLAERSSDKKMFAIKVIHPQMLSSGGHLNAFRRGAYAMRLLTKRQVSGMASFEEAFEVPFSIVMEYVDGQDLENAIDNHFIESLLVRLKVMRRIAEVIYLAHSIKEQVLHRDLKPGNVLLSGYTYEDENPQSYVKLVDFDLCWHKYATAETIVHHKGSRGYAAPEMFDKSLGSTRNSSVDVYGLGMLLYYILTGKHPVPGMTSRSSFECELAEEIRRRYKSKWTALGWHLARCTTISTGNIPKDRCNIPDLIAMLDTAIALEGDQDSSTYLPILGMQIMELVVDTGIKVEYTDFGRTIEHVRDVKSLKCKLINERSGVSIISQVRITKDERLSGASHEKRDHKVEERIKRDIDTKKYEFHWTANRSKREATISTRLSSPNFNEIEDFSSLIRLAWHEIEHN